MEYHQLSLLRNSLLESRHANVRTFPFRPRLGLMPPPSIGVVIKTNASGFIHPSRTVCVAWLYFEGISGVVLFTCVETVLVIRGQRPFPRWGRQVTPRISVFAFYGRTKALLSFILTLFVAEIAAQVVIIAVTAGEVNIIPNPLPSTLDATACLPLNVPSLLPNLWYGQNPVEYLDRSYVSLDF